MSLPIPRAFFASFFSERLFTTISEPGTGYKVVSYQHSISCIKTLGVGFPALCLLLHNRSIGREVQTRELDIVDETVALDAFEKEMKKCFKKVQWYSTVHAILRFAIFNEEKVRLIC